MTIRELVTYLGFKIDDKTLTEYNRKVESAKKKSADLSSAVGGIGKALKFIGGAVAVAGITALGNSILDTTGEVEQYRVTLGTMIGDQEKANKIIHDLDYSPVSDFYGTAAAIGGLQGMVTFGMQAEEASDTLTRLGDIAQGSGGAFKSLSLNMGQVFAKGKADATDLKQFVGQGFDVVGEVSKMTGKSRAEIEKAGVSYEQCAAALKHITSEGGKYNGMLAKQSKTLPGLKKQFQSLTAAIKEGIGSNVIDRVKDIMKAVLDFGRSMQDNIVAVGTKAFEAILNVIADVYIAFHLLKQEMEKYGGAFTAIKALVKDVFGFMESVFQSSRPYILAIAQAILLAFKPIEAFVRPVLEALKPLFKNVFGYAAEQINALLPFINALTPAFAKAGDMIAGLIGKLAPIFKNLHNAIMAAFEPLEAFVVPIFKALWGVVEMVFGAISKVLDDTADATSGLAGIIESLTPIMSVLGNIIGGIITVLANGLSVVLPALKPIAGIILGIVAAVKIWSAAQAVLNAVMSANPIGLIILAVVALIGIIVTLVKNWDAIKTACLAAFEIIKDAVLFVVEKIKAVWSGITDFFGGLWDGIVSAATIAWSGFVNIFSPIVDGIKAVWSGITDFFGGLWDALKNSPLEALEFIRDTFFGLFDGLKQKFFGFIDTIKAGWDKVKGFFGGLWDGAVSLFTGGESKEAPEPTKVNDMILTPDGTYSTHPDDTIFAMKDPGSLVDRLAEFFARSAPKPAYALAGNSASQAVRQSVSNDYSSHSSSSVFNAPIRVTVNASGMTAEQARRAVESGVKGALREAIAGSRGSIPSPEARSA